jgi:hypothetical protein
MGIPDDADPCSGHADHPFRADPDQLIVIVGTVIATHRNVFHRAT